MKLSRYFDKIISCSRILPGLKNNLKYLELFETLNDYWLEKEKRTKSGNYYIPCDSSWYFDSNYEIDMIMNKSNDLYIKMIE